MQRYSKGSTLRITTPDSAHHCSDAATPSCTTRECSPCGKTAGIRALNRSPTHCCQCHTSTYTCPHPHRPCLPSRHNAGCAGQPPPATPPPHEGCSAAGQQCVRQVGKQVVGSFGQGMWHQQVLTHMPHPAPSFHCITALLKTSCTYSPYSCCSSCCRCHC